MHGQDTAPVIGFAEDAGASNPTKRRVLNFWPAYGARSESWLYRLLTNMNEWEPHILADATEGAERMRREQPWPVSRLHLVPRRAPARGVRERLLASWGRLLHGGTKRYLLARCIKSALMQWRFDIFHFHHGWTVPRSMMGRLPVPGVVSFYGSDVFRASGSYLKRLKSVLRGPHSFIVLSGALLEALLALGAPRDRTHVVPVGIDVSDFPSEEAVAERRKSPPKRQASILSVGRLVDFKAPHLLPCVARMLRDRGLSFEWKLVGTGELESQVAKSIEDNGVSDCFHMMGSLPFEEVRSLMWEADLMVHNAVVAPDGGRESLGVVLIEAAAMALPVVSCRVGGIPEVVIDGETGFLVAEGDLAGMAEKVADLCTDQDLRVRTGISAMARARTVFDSATLASEVEEVYSQLVT